MEIPNDPAKPEWTNKRLFERDGVLYVCAQTPSDDIAVWESTDNGITWHAPTEEVLISLITP
jgi:hypothetical protein